KDAALPLNRFNQHSADIIRELLSKVRDIIEFHKFESGHERFKRFAIFDARGSGQCAECPAMKRILESEDAKLFRLSAAFAFCPYSCKLETSFDGFSAGVREKRAVHARERTELFSQASLILVIEKVGNVKRPFDLLAQHLFHARMVVAQSIDANSGQQV